MINIIVAHDLNNGIGYKGKIPWHLKGDFINFKKITSGHTVVMGRKTFESIGKPLPNRRNIVLTRDENWKFEGAEVRNDPASVLALDNVYKEPIFILGGEEIYKWFLPYTEKLYVTLVNEKFEADTFFPEKEREDFVITTGSMGFEENGIKYQFIELERDRNRDYHVSKLPIYDANL